MWGWIRSLRWLAMAVGALMAFLAQNSPKDVRSNFSYWFEEASALAGGAEPPAWLANPFIDTVATWLGIGLVTAAALGIIIPWILRRRSPTGSRAEPAEKTVSQLEAQREAGSSVQLRRSALRQEKADAIARWRTMLANTASAVRERDADIRTVLLGSPEYLSLEPYLDVSVCNFVRTGVLSYGRTSPVPSEDEAEMSYEDRVLFHLNKGIERIEREWAAGGG